jgi:sensor histidine kinase regulating citrate/malate metabolism
MEIGGSEIATPSKTGFGSLLLQQSLVYDLEASIDMEYLPTGLVSTIKLPASRVLLED